MEQSRDVMVSVRFVQDLISRVCDGDKTLYDMAATLQAIGSGSPYPDTKAIRKEVLRKEECESSAASASFAALLDQAESENWHADKQTVVRFGDLLALFREAKASARLSEADAERLARRIADEEVKKWSAERAASNAKHSTSITVEVAYTCPGCGCRPRPGAASTFPLSSFGTAGIAKEHCEGCGALLEMRIGYVTPVIVRYTAKEYLEEAREAATKDEAP